MMIVMRMMLMLMRMMRMVALMRVLTVNLNQSGLERPCISNFDDNYSDVEDHEEDDDGLGDDFDGESESV